MTQRPAPQRRDSDQSTADGLSRRRLLVVFAGSAARGLLAACSSPPAPPAAATTAPAVAAPTSAPAAASPKPAASAAPSAPSPSPAVVASPSAVAAPTTAPAVAAGGKTIKAAFVYTGPINDHGWTNAHDDRRKALEQALGSGVQATNPDAKIHMVWINTWFDPPKEKAGAESVLDLNADVLTGTTDSPSLAQAAAARGKYAVGVDYDQSSYAPAAILQSDRFLWGPHYINSVKAVMSGTWKPVQYYYHVKDGMVEATPPSNLVPADIAKMAMDVHAQIKAGTFNIWKGPLTDNHGNVN